MQTESFPLGSVSFFLEAEARACHLTFGLGLSNWAALTENLRPWERSLAYSLGQRAATGREPSLKQAIQGLKALEEAPRLALTSFMP